MSSELPGLLRFDTKNAHGSFLIDFADSWVSIQGAFEQSTNTEQFSDIYPLHNVGKINVGKKNFHQSVQMH